MFTPVKFFHNTQKEFKIGISKSYRDVVKLTKFSVNFGNTADLHPTARKLLEILEIRSWDNNGDTKIHDTKLAELCKVSTRAIQRWTRRLEQDGFIVKTYRRFFDETKAATDRGGFYTDRAIRCLRIFLAHRCVAKSTKEIGWRTDPRPGLERSLYQVDKSWITDVNYEYDYYPDGILPAFQDLFDAMKKGILDPEVYSKHRELSEAREMGNLEAIAILGRMKFQGAT